MAHPRMYDDEDPLLQRLREVCLALPGAGEKESHGRPNFFCSKVFAVYGGGGLDLDAPGTDWAEVAELVDASYRLVAPRRRVAELDARWQ